MAGLCHYLATKKYDWFYDLIVHILIVTMCVKYGIEQAFSLTDTGEFVFKSTVLTLRCSLLLAAFACNGLVDILIGFIPPTFVVVFALTKT